MSRPLVSICIPTRNGSSYIRSTIESVLCQTYPNLEIIISDQGSTDETLDVVSELADDRFIVQMVPLDGGAEANWNAVVAQARGSYVKLLCQDDLLHASAVSSQVASLEREPSASFVFGPRDVISPRGRVLLHGRGWSSDRGHFRIERDLPELVRSGTNLFGEPCTTLYRTSYLRLTRGFRGSYLIDLDMCLQLLHLGPAVHLADTLSSFRISASSWSRALSREQSIQIRALLNSIRSDYPEMISTSDVDKGVRRAEALERKRRIVLGAVRFLRI